MNITLPRLAIAIAAMFATATAWCAALTNADVVKMVQANLDESIIVTAIQNSETKFDTSAQGLIELSTAKVPQSIITTMIKRGAQAAPTAPAAPNAAGGAAAAPASESMSPSEILMVDGDQTTPMRYLTPQSRTAARGLGFGGVATYAVLRGTHANSRTKNRTPSFIVSVPNQAQVESYLTLANFAVRPNNSREVMVGGGYMSYSTGIHPDRVVAVTSEKMADQSRAQKGFTIYKVTPKGRLLPGEYAVVLYTGEMQSIIGAWFAGGGNSFFDFGVDT